ncbi:MAG TPA: ATP phosphoribosyltransferase regulatory subunit [Candidatus Cloacimonadota bacterium]|nr:ATP phosphoribosyltransferase regulatory subunit [Candidatus Cloacimonadota bacterium]
MPEKHSGFHEFMPEDVWKWKIIESRVEDLLALYNYQEIRLSILQDHKVLHDGITALMQEDQAQDVEDKVLSLSGPDQSISLLSLRPEGTISVLHHTAKLAAPGDLQRLYYHGPMFRKDKQGNPMEFYQLGIEYLGSDSVLSENEVISLGMRICKQLGLHDIYLELNSFGCQTCRRPFKAAIRTYLEEHRNALCAHCYKVLYANPNAETGCTEPECLEVMAAAPKISEFLCPTCKKNFSKVKQIQANLAHSYKVNPAMLKNFSYYNETVFDFLLKNNGKPVMIGGGGRYDYLAERITGRKIPAVGFYLNLDTIFELMQQRKLFSRNTSPFTVYLCAQTQDMDIMLLQLASELHDYGITTYVNPEIQDTESERRNAAAQGASLMLILRDENIREGKILLHNLVKEYPAYIPLNQVVGEILLAQKSLTK